MGNLLNEQYELMKIEIEKARDKGDFKTEIFLAEKLGFYFHAGKIAKSHGLFKRASENFKKEKEENLPNRLTSIDNLQEIEQMLSQKRHVYITTYSERIAKGNWNKPLVNRLEENLIRHFKGYQTGQFSSDRIKTYN